MKEKDYYKPTHLCGVYNGAKTGTEGWSHMVLTCVAYGNNYEEVVQNYMENVMVLHPFWEYSCWECRFTKRNGVWRCDGRLIEVGRSHDSFIEGKHEPYRVERVPSRITH